jgi:hypothetical protein
MFEMGNDRPSFRLPFIACVPGQIPERNELLRLQARLRAWRVTADGCCAFANQATVSDTLAAMQNPREVHRPTL